MLDLLARFAAIRLPDPKRITACRSMLVHYLWRERYGKNAVGGTWAYGEYYVPALRQIPKLRGDGADPNVVWT